MKGALGEGSERCKPDTGVRKGERAGKHSIRGKRKWKREGKGKKKKNVVTSWEGNVQGKGGKGRSL